ncbi:PP2C family protein-serine/threonine phosphatase [Leptospira sp. GIMC2001]|uniref:PP2C family protein-serine/threonine phosphatase n=1 Tax=Leptospira sp. GIMC2001 TaxID=1513297 RepID=UPI00234BEF67|nr:SpoIIE family protein phosphatase [Leptospira sp. GIMC2001]WCL50023.1 SpoIIE family protein phosphatase [Leptospira sp. GIMC2001]
MSLYSFFSKIYKNYLEYEIDQPQARKTYWDELNAQCLKGALPAAFISLFAFIRYIDIDRQLHPEIPELYWARIGLTISGIITFVLYAFPIFRKQGIFLWLIPAGYVEIGTAWITARVGGEPSYIASYVLVLMLFVIVPFPLIISISLMAMSALTFIFTYNHYVDHDTPLTVSQSLITLRNAFVIGSVFIFFLDRIRKRSYLKSIKIIAQKDKVEKLLVKVDREILLARKIQTSLLPKKIPDEHRINLNFHYSPVTNLGGDFIDINYSRKDEIGIFICDVSGHGVPAAFLASMVKMSLNNWADNLQEPAKVLIGIHNSLKGKLTGNFITASMCYINLNTGKMKVAGAGHLPLLLLRKSGEVNIFQPKGRVICDLFPPDCVDMDVSLGNGDKFVLFTDGITEARNSSSDMFGDDRFKNLISKQVGYNTREICENVMREVSEFVGHHREFQDDVTIVAAEFNN